jgi:flavin-dependent dehydrogenase
MIGMYDCIVIGGGPGGATAAYHLARVGRKVLLLEKAQWPRTKPCGGGVSPQVAQWLPFDLQPAISTTVSRLRFTWDMGAPIEADLGTHTVLWMVRREIFDQLIMDQARITGAWTPRPVRWQAAISSQRMVRSAGPPRCSASPL